jgi:hypothetical protein
MAKPRFIYTGKHPCRLRSLFRARNSTFLKLLINFTLISVFASPLPPVSAQGDAGDWITPVNLSRSGNSSNSNMVVDSHGIVHVFWADSNLGEMYTRFEEDGWSQPVAVDFPFSSYQPQLIATQDDAIHAFWVDQSGYLKHSKVYGSVLSSRAAWEPAETLGVQIIAFRAAADPKGGLHLAFLQDQVSPDNPAGMYYLQDSGNGWGGRRLLYQSAYLRGLQPGGANIDITATVVNDAIRLHILWDNPSRKQLFTVRSTDGGATWDEGIPVDDAIDNPGVSAFTNLRTMAQSQETLIVWEAGETSYGESSNCSLYYLATGDGGETWSEKRAVGNQLSGCPENPHFLQLNSGSLYLLYNLLGRVYLTAWDGARWGHPIVQSALSSFQDPEIGSVIKMGCVQIVEIPGEQLFATGCDQNGGGDIWFTSRSLQSLSVMASGSTVWNTTELLQTTTETISAMRLLADSTGNLSALWVQRHTLGENDEEAGFYLSTRMGSQWTEPFRIASVEGGIQDAPAIAVSQDDFVYVLFREKKSGTFQLLAAPDVSADDPSLWEQPTSLPISNQNISEPDLAIEPDGSLLVIYAVQINEGRGVYTIRSTDRGKTWATPAVVFDAAAAGWAIVDHPRIAVSENGERHATWQRYDRFSEPATSGLFYAYSAAGSDGWSEVQTIYQGAVEWGAILTIGQAEVHRFWQEASGYHILWHQASQDGGETWGSPDEFSVLAENSGTPGITVDREGHIHLAKTYWGNATSPVLREWLWVGSGWEIKESLDLALLNLTADLPVTLAISPDGELGVLYIEATISASRKQQEELLFNSRQFTLPFSLPGTKETEAPRLAGTPTFPPTGTPTARVTESSYLMVPQGTLPAEILNAAPSGDNYAGLKIGAGVAFVLVGLFFGVRVWLRRSRK